MARQTRTTRTVRRHRHRARSRRFRRPFLEALEQRIVLSTLGDITGTQFHDQNANGVQDTGEVGLADWTIYLDANDNGALDTGEPSTLTGADGGYAFADVLPGQHAVRALPNNGWEQVYPGLFGGPTTYGAGNWPVSVVSADFDGDGHSDVALANQYSNNVSVLKNDGTGSFAAATNFGVGVLPFGLSKGDFDGDGDVDLAAANRTSNTVSILLNDGSGSFAAAINVPTGSHPLTIGVVDLDGDLDLDLVVTNLNDDTLTVLENNGSGSFSFLATISVGDVPVDVAAGDFDADGDMDLVVANENANTVSVLYNQGNGSFSERVDLPVELAPASMTVGDINGDGAPDLITPNRTSGSVSVLLNQGNGEFLAASHYAAGAGARSTVLVDFDGDGDLDVAVANSWSPIVSVLMNEGNGTLAAPISIPAGPSAFALAAADLDNDGRPDLAVAALSANGMTVLRNAGGAQLATVTADATTANVNFGSRRTLGDITGTKFHDENANGVQDAGELGLADWTIYLDANENGTLDTGEASTVTAADGTYAFIDLEPGDYVVREVAQSSWRQTAPGLAFAAGVATGTGVGPHRIVSGDLDGDGYADLVTANFSASTVSRQMNNGDGTFTAAADLTAGIGAGPAGVEVADLNGDGHLDIVTANRDSHNVSVLLNDGFGNFTAGIGYPAGTSPHSVRAADLDGDGDLDLVVPNRDSQDVSILINDGNGVFALPAAYAVGGFPFESAIADLDGDGDLDLAVDNATTDNVSVLLNQGNGTFAAAINFAVGDGPHSITAADLDGDGDIDLATANNFSGDVSLLYNQGNATFAAAANVPAGSPLDITAVDVDGDGDIDLITADGPTYATVLLNDGAGGFGETLLIPAAGGPRAVVAEDLDGDGDIDLAIANFSANSVTVARNDLGLYRLSLLADQVETEIDFGNVAISNHLPTVVNPIGDMTVDEDAGETVIVLTGVFDDSDGDALTYSAASSDESLVTASVTGTDLVLSYVTDQHGSATITVTATDSLNATGSGSFTVTVDPVNDAPVAADDSYVVDEDTTLRVVTGIDIAANLVTHYDANAISGVSVGERVVQWDDVSGNLNHATQAAGAADVGTYISSGIGGQPAVEFSRPVGAVGDGYQSTYSMGNQFGISGDAGWTMVWVVRIESTVGGWDHVGSLGHGSYANGLAALELQEINGDKRLDIAGGWSHDVVLGPTDSFYDADDPTTDLAGEDLIITVTHAGNTGLSEFATTQMFINGWQPGEGQLAGTTLDFTGNASTTPFGLADTQLGLGAIPTMALPTGFNGLMSEVLIFDDALTDEERRQLEQGLGEKYGISGDLGGINTVTNGILENDSDVDGDVLTAVLVSDVSHGTLMLSADGSFDYTPDANWHGTDSFAYNAYDGTDNSNTATVTITVGSTTNNAPTVANPFANTAVDEDAGETVIDLTGVFDDADGDALTYSAASSDESLVTASISGTDLVLAYVTDQHGSATITVTAIDPSSDSASDEFIVTVNSVNDAPVLALIGDTVVDEESVLSFAVTASDPNDVPPNNLVLGVTGLPTGATFNTTTGAFSWTPTGTQQGSYDITFTVTDDGTPTLSDSETISITVNDVITSTDRSIWQELDGTGTAGTVYIAVTLEEAIDPAVENAFDAYQQHLDDGKFDEAFELTPLKVRLVHFTDFERLLQYGTFSGIYDNPVVGSYYSETLTGTNERDLIVALAGNDVLNGLAGDDILVGGSGNDSFHGDAGDDVVLFSGTDAGYDVFDGGDGTDRAIAIEPDTEIGVNGYDNGVDRIEGHADGDTIVRDSYYSRTLDFSQTELINIAEVDAGSGNDTIIASDLSPGVYRGGSGNDTLDAGLQDTTWVYAGLSNGHDKFQDNGASTVIARAETAGTVIGVDGYANGVDRIEGHADGDTIVRDSYYSRTLDFSQTELINIAEVDAGSGNDTIIASDLSPGVYRGGSGNDTLDAGLQDTTWVYAGPSNGHDKFQDNGASTVIARAETAGTVIGVDGYANGVDRIEGHADGDTIVRDSYYSRTLDFSQTELINIAEVDAGSGNDTIIASDLSPGVYRGGSGNDTLDAGLQDTTWVYAGPSNGHDKFQDNGASTVIARAETAGTVIGVDGYANGVDRIEGHADGDTIVRDSYYSRTLDFSQTELINIAEVDAGSGNDTIIASDLSPGVYRGGSGNDTLDAGLQETTWVYAGSSNGHDKFQDNGASTVIARAETAGTVIGVDGYANGVDRIEGHADGDTIVRDSYYSRTLDFSQTELINIAEVDAGSGNDTIIASDLSPGVYRGGSGNDTLDAGLQDTTWVYAGPSNGHDKFQDNGDSTVIARAETAGTVIGVDGYANGVDRIEGHADGDTIVRDSYYSRTLDFSQTELINIAEIDAGSGNDTIATSNRSTGHYRGGAGSDHFVVSVEAATAAIDIAILDFEDGVDRIDLSEFGLDAETLLESLSIAQDGDDVVIELPDQNKTIRLIDFVISDLDADDFLL